MIVCAAIVHNGAKYVARNICYLRNALPNMRFVVLENDSTDGTAEILTTLPFVHALHFNLGKSSRELCAKTEPWNCPRRVQRLAFLRQNALTYALNLKPEYVVVVDLDFTTFDRAILREMFETLQKRQDLDCICGASVNTCGYTYDVPYDLQAVQPVPAKLLLSCGCHARLLNSASGFGGVAIYRAQKLMTMKTHYNLQTQTVEHVDFHRNLRVIIDTKMRPVYANHCRATYGLALHLLWCLIVTALCVRTARLLQ